MTTLEELREQLRSGPAATNSRRPANPDAAKGKLAHRVPPEGKQTLGYALYADREIEPSTLLINGRERCARCVTETPAGVEVTPYRIVKLSDGRLVHILEVDTIGCDWAYCAEPGVAAVGTDPWMTPCGDCGKDVAHPLRCTVCAGSRCAKCDSKHTCFADEAKRKCADCGKMAMDVEMRHCDACGEHDMCPKCHTDHILWCPDDDSV